MIKIGPFATNELKQVALLLQFQEEVRQEATAINENDLALKGLAFWQHWLPCQLHIAPSLYVAREEGQVLGVIQLHHMSKSRGCWQIDQLVIHPEHRGRGIAQELLRYVFAQFGSQGVMHFLAEVPTANDGALSLFASCGFCRSSRITFYRFNPEKYKAKGQVKEGFRLALPHLKQGLFQLHSEVLPPTLRQALLLMPDDFDLKEPLPFTSVERRKQKLMRSRTWYWVSDDIERRVLTAAVKVKSDPDRGYLLEFFVHPGWKHLSEDLISFAIEKLLADVPRGPIWAKVYDFQPELNEFLVANSFERSGESFLLLREHWQRATKKSRNATIPQLSSPVINFPLATDRVQLPGQLQKTNSDLAHN
jgi:GNAT superfamily N-acetyltransferase